MLRHVADGERPCAQAPRVQELPWLAATSALRTDPPPPTSAANGYGRSADQVKEVGRGGEHVVTCALRVVDRTLSLTQHMQRSMPAPFAYRVSDERL